MPQLLFEDRFGYPNGIITNEYALNHPDEPGVHVNPYWDATSGTIYARQSKGYSGVPDVATQATIDSTLGNNSARLRVVTKRMDFLNVSVRFKLINIQLVTALGVRAWDGIHVSLRRYDEDNVYYADVNRRDSRVHVKRKRGRNSYNALPNVGHFAAAFGVEQDVRIESWTDADDYVQFRTYIDGVLALQTQDASPLRLSTAGAAGIRGDNCEFEIDDFEVWRM